jgi:hypothetical protein
MKKSKLADAILRGRRPEPEPTRRPGPRTKAASGETTAQPSPIIADSRQTGKRSDTDYTQVSAYIRKATHRGVRAALILGESDRDFGELVDDLLEEWLRSLPEDIRRASSSQRKK